MVLIYFCMDRAHPSTNCLSTLRRNPPFLFLFLKWLFAKFGLQDARRVIWSLSREHFRYLNTLSTILGNQKACRWWPCEGYWLFNMYYAFRRVNLNGFYADGVEFNQGTNLLNMLCFAEGPILAVPLWSLHDALGKLDTFQLHLQSIACMLHWKVRSTKLTKVELGLWLRACEISALNLGEYTHRIKVSILFNPIVLHDR
jgi:hypothetical protein